VQPTGSDNSAERFFTPVRFGILLALLIFAAFPQVLLGLQTFVVRDYGFYSYPTALFQQLCFRHGQLPFWDPYNYCGVPFLAQWNTMPLYPPSLIYLALPLTWSLSFFCLLHLWFAGFGMFQLTRHWTGLRRAEVSSVFNGCNDSPASAQLSSNAATATQAGSNFAAAFAGVAFSFNGLTLNLLMWPSHIATLSWMPWVVLAVESAWREGGRKIFLAAMVGAMQMLAGGPETIFLTWLLLLALWIQQLATGGGDASSPMISATGASQPRMAMFRRFPFIVLLVIALTAVQLLPFLDLAAHSERHGNYADFRWSMPAWGWANFLVPMAFGSIRNMGVFFQYDQLWTSSYYLGIGTLWLALLAVWRGRPGRVRMLGAVAAIAFIFALGEHTPVYPALHRLIPVLSLITYPVKFVLLVAFSTPLLAAFGLAAIREQPGVARRVAFLGAILLALIGGILFWAWRFPMPGDDVHATLLNGLSRGGFLLLTGALLFVLSCSGAAALRRAAALLLLPVAWLDVQTHEPTQNPTVPANIYEPNLARTRLAMNPQPELGGSRAMLTPMAEWQFVHSAISSPQNNFLIGRLAYGADCNLLDAVPKVDGFYSLTPRENDDVLSLFYTRTNANFPGLEDFMGVSQISAPDQIYHWQSRPNFLPLVTAGQKPVFLDDAKTLEALMQPNFNGNEIVFLPPEAKSLVAVTNQTSARVTNLRFGNQSVAADIEASEASLVVVSQSYYHDWRAFVDGHQTPLLRANHAFQAIQVPAGAHQIRLTYEDRAFETGAAFSIAAWLACLLALFIPLRPKKMPRC
jgi:hypothetical protein